MQLSFDFSSRLELIYHKSSGNNLHQVYDKLIDLDSALFVDFLEKQFLYGNLITKFDDFVIFQNSKIFAVDFFDSIFRIMVSQEIKSGKWFIKIMDRKSGEIMDITIGSKIIYDIIDSTKFIVGYKQSDYLKYFRLPNSELYTFCLN